MHRSSDADRDFRDRFEACEIAPAEFGHREHLRLAYVYLTEDDVEGATRAMREALLEFLDHNDVELTRYHETMTRAWILAVRHFMEKTPGSESAESFIEANPIMLDSKIMLTHYSADLLFSDAARAGFVEPDLDPIPRYAKDRGAEGRRGKR